MGAGRNLYPLLESWNLFLPGDNVDRLVGYHIPAFQKWIEIPSSSHVKVPGPLLSPTQPDESEFVNINLIPVSPSEQNATQRGINLFLPGDNVDRLVGYHIPAFQKWIEIPSSSHVFLI
jgi:hypothetical protein